MIQLKIEPGRALQILCLGAHSDDIEIGCGGTVLRLAEENPDCVFHWVVFSAIGDREAEARRAASAFRRLRWFTRALTEDVSGWVHAVCGRRN